MNLILLSIYLTEILLYVGSQRGLPFGPEPKGPGPKGPGPKRPEPKGPGPIVSNLLTRVGKSGASIRLG